MSNPVIVSCTWNVNQPTTLVKNNGLSFAVDNPFVFYGDELQISLAWVDDNHVPVDFQLDSVVFGIGELGGEIIANGDWEQDQVGYAWRTNVSLDAPVLNAFLNGAPSKSMVVEARVTDGTFVQSYLGTITLFNTVIPVTVSPVNLFSSSSSSSSSSTALSFSTSSSSRSSSSRSGSTALRTSSSSSSTFIPGSSMSSASSWSSKSTSSSTEIHTTSSSSSTYHTEVWVGQDFGNPIYNTFYHWAGNYNGHPYWTDGTAYLFFNGLGDNGYALATSPTTTTAVDYSREVVGGIPGDYRMVNGTAPGGFIGLHLPSSSSSMSSTALLPSSASSPSSSTQARSSSSRSSRSSLSQSSRSSPSSLSSPSSFSMSMSSLHFEELALDIEKPTTGGQVSAPASTVWSTTPLTVEFWWRTPDVTATYVMFSTDSAFDPFGWMVNQSSGQLQVLCNDGDIHGGTTNYIQTSGAVLTSNTWYHIAFCADSSNLRLYLNGVPTGVPQNGVTTGVSPFTNGGMTAVNEPLWFYDDNDAGDFTDGHEKYLDEIRISNTVRYPTGFAPSTAKCFALDGSTISYWQCNDSGSTVHDLTGNHNATWTGTPSYVAGIGCAAAGDNSSSSTSSTAISFSTSSSRSSPSSRSSASSLSSPSSAGQSASSSSTFLKPSSASSMSSMSPSSRSTASSPSSMSPSSKSSPSSLSTASSASSKSTSSSTSSPTTPQALIFGDALIGGSGANVTAHKSGTLYLGFNDNYYGDNSGQFSVTIKINGGALHNYTVPSATGGNGTSGAPGAPTAGVATVAVTHGDTINVQATGTAKWNLSSTVYPNGQDTTTFAYQGVGDSSFWIPAAERYSVVGWIV